MEFKDGTNVYTFDGKDVGKLQRVVIDPETKDVTHIVVQKGLFFKEDKVIGVDKVDSASMEEITLNCVAAELKEMAPLNIKEYVSMGETSGRDPEHDIYWNAGPDHSLIAVTKRTIPADLVALKEGARVVSEEGSHMGNVERVLTDPETGKVNSFTIAQGLLNKTRKSVPIQWVKYLDDDMVQLAVEAREVEDLPAGEG